VLRHSATSITLALALASCAAPKTILVAAPVVKLRLSPPDTALTKPCAKPTGVPERDLKQGEVEALWIKDRVGLATCGKRLEGLAKFIKVRDAKLQASR
jgi:hypothetical protein